MSEEQHALLSQRISAALEAIRVGGSWHEVGLDLGGLGLFDFPPVPPELYGIRHLNLSRNKLQHLPSWITSLHSLEVLNLSNNQFSLVPKILRGCTDLVELDLSNNCLEAVPQWIGALRHLRYLNLLGNDLLHIPMSIMSGCSPAAIARYSQMIQGSETVPLLEAKLIIVGPGSAGKTSLLKRLIGRPPDPAEPETHSLNIEDFERVIGGKSVLIHAWDFGGQEILLPTHRMFLTDRTLYLLVLEPRTNSADREAEYWLKLIRSVAPASPVILALNKSETRQWTLDENRFRRRYPQIIGLVATDALSGLGIPQLVELLDSGIGTHLTEVWALFPKRWQFIKAQLTRMSQNFLDYDQYREICSYHGEEDAKQQAELANILHILGLVLYYGDDRKLRDTRVLNPRWVTRAVYAVIRSNILRKRGGIIDLNDVSDCFDEAFGNGIRRSDYPKKSLPFIVELMQKFEMCISVSNELGIEESLKSSSASGQTSEKWLVPELLPDCEPHEVGDWFRADLKFRFRFTRLPSGLVPKLIVRILPDVDYQLKWRSGFIFQYVDCSCLVQSDPEDGDVVLSIKGGDSGQRRFVASLITNAVQSIAKCLATDVIEQLELEAGTSRWVNMEFLRALDLKGNKTSLVPIEPSGTAEVDVGEKLGQVYNEASRVVLRGDALPPPPVRMFVSYCHADSKKLKGLKPHLDYLAGTCGLTPWVDTQLVCGEDFEQEIRQRLDQMDIYLFLASPASLASNFIRTVEIKRAIERHKKREIRMCIVKLEECLVDLHPQIGGLQRLCPSGGTYSSNSPRSRFWYNVVEALLPIISTIQEEKSRSV